MSESTKAVFLSYAREDAEPVRRIADALRAFGVEVWFDQNELRGGDAWDQKIRTQIRTCTLCLPVISAATQARGEGYFRREWKFAVERTYDMAAGVPFLLPIVIDDTKESAALVPDEFMKVQWTRLPQGVPTPQFVEQVKRLLSGEPFGVAQGRQGAGSGEQGRTQRSEVRGQGSEVSGAARKSAIPGWTWGVVTAVVIGIGAALYISRQPAPVAASASEPKAAAATPSPVTRNPEPAARRAADKSIAVLPFTNMSEDKESGFFADGVHEDVLTNLALIRELRVVSRTSVMPYRTTTKSMRQIAEDLGVTYILEGSVRRSGNKVRVTGQLIHAGTDEHIWAASYDRELTDIFTIQAELSRQIAAAMKAALSPEEKVMIARRPTENPAAYDLYLKARDLWNRESGTVSAITRRIAYLQDAVNLDPTFAQAWGKLAEACANAAFNSYDGMDDYLARAQSAIARAQQLAPDDPETISSVGTFHYYAFRDYDRATEQYEKLAHLQPNSPSVFNSLGLIQRRQGHWAESLVYFHKATELDPANIGYQRNLLGSLHAGRRWDEELVVQRRIVALLPDSLREGYRLATLPFYARGSTREGDEFFARLSPTELNSPEGIELRGAWAGTKGDYAEAIRLDKLQPYFEGYGVPHWRQAFGAAMSYWAAGDGEGAIARLKNYPAELRQDLVKETNNRVKWALLGGMELILGHKEEGLRCVERATATMPISRDAIEGAIYANYLATCYDLAGDKERALAEYERQINIPSTIDLLNVHALKRNPSTLRGDPRFEALLNDSKNNAPLF